MLRALYKTIKTVAKEPILVQIQQNHDAWNFLKPN